LPSCVRGRFFYLYMAVDIYSRKIVGRDVHEQEDARMAARLIEGHVASR
jgi:hypothetical protein